jgi:hypothetical protein
MIKKSNVTLFILFLILLIAMLRYIFYGSYTSTKNFYTKPQASSENNNPLDRVIVTVGKEKIFQKDYDIELFYYPDKNDPSVRKNLLQKLINDSIILQGGNRDGLIPLDKSIFNSPDKDYMKRIKVVEQVKQGIEQQTDSIEATIVSIWFYNNDWIGLLGYEGGKRFAHEKITYLYDLVKHGDISIDEAGNIIKSDTSLEQIDKAYTNNAIAHVRTEANSQITLSKEFDQKLRLLPVGQISDVYLASVKEDDTEITRDAVYLFGVITKRTYNPTLISFESWLDKKRKLYEIIY